MGDADLKPAVTAQPEVVQHQLSSQDEFVVLASDGLWDKLSNEEAVGLVYDTVKQPVMAAQRCAGCSISAVSTNVCVAQQYTAGSSFHVTCAQASESVDPHPTADSMFAYSSKRSWMRFSPLHRWCPQMPPRTDTWGI